MPKSRNRSRSSSRLTQHHPPQRRWVKWLALILPASLLIATLLGLFGTGTLSAPTSSTTPVPAASR